MQNCISTFDSGYVYYSSYGILARLDINADTLWAKQYYIDNNFAEGKVIQTRDSGFLIWTENPAHGEVLIRTDKHGDTLWTKYYFEGSYGYVSKRRITETSDGSFIFTPASNTSICKIDSSGNFLWGKSYDFGPMGSDGISIKELSDGNYILMGSINYDCFLLKTDTAGNPIWYKKYQNPFSNVAANLMELNNHGDIVISAGIFIPGNFYGSAALIAVDSSGTVKWSRYYNGNSGSGYMFIAPTADDGYIGCCGIAPPMNAVTVMKLNETGVVEWSNIISDTLAPYLYFFHPTKDGGCIATVGSTTQSFISKFDSSGNNGCNTSSYLIASDTFTINTVGLSCTVNSYSSMYYNPYVTINDVHFLPVNCLAMHTENPAMESLNVYPNPASSEVRIENENSEITLAKLFDLYGKEIFDSGIINAQHFKIDCRDFPSGIYFLNVHLAGEMVTRKIIIE